MPRTFAPLIGALSLVLGFAAAQATGNRALGGAVLLLGGAWCVWAWWRSPGPARPFAAVAVFAVAFALSHPLGRVIGAWPSVLLVAAAAGAITWRMASGGETAAVAGAPMSGARR